MARMSTRFADTFRRLQPAILVRLKEMRSAVELSETQVSELEFDGRYEHVLERIQRALESGNDQSYRASVERFAALRIGEGATPESMAHSLLAVYDAIVQTARAELPAGAATTAFVREIVRLQLFCVRVLVGAVVEEFERLQARQSEESSQA
jgi:hypothetical protein